MSDIEGGHRPRPGAGPQRPGQEQHQHQHQHGARSWLGSLLRPQSAPPPEAAGGASQSTFSLFQPFRRISTVHEERSAHLLLHGSLTSPQQSAAAPHGSDLHSQSAPHQQQQHQHRRGTLDRAAEPLQQLYGSGSVGSDSAYGHHHHHAHSAPGAQRQWGGGSTTSSADVGGIGVSSGSAGSLLGPSGSRGGPTGGVPKLATTAMGDTVIGRQSMVVKVSEGAAKKYMHMMQGEEQAQVTSSGHHRGWGVIHPLDRRYRIWWYITVVAAAITGWLTPFRLAFMNVGYHNLEGHAVLEVVLLAIFCCDIIVSFLVGFYNEQGLLVMEPIPVAVHYIRRRLWVDLITTLPFDWIVLSATQISTESAVGRYIALLAVLKLGRMYRLVVMFYNISYNLNVGLLSLTLMRNFTFCLYLLHWAACAFWYIAVQEELAHPEKKTWVDNKEDMLKGASVVELYIFSFYWALVTFATLGYGDVTPISSVEVLFTIIYVAINIVVWAYILGTITLLVTRQDEELGAYRQRMQALTAYCNANNLPVDLKHTMAGLLRLHMSLQNEALGDEQVLSVFPTTIRRKILRQLYSHPLRSCYLFDATGVKFLDALMLGARVELFLPKVEIVSALDHANELYVVVAGYVEVVDPTMAAAAAAAAAGEGEEPSSHAEDGHDKSGSAGAAHNPLHFPHFLKAPAPGPDAEDAFSAGMLSGSTLPQHRTTSFGGQVLAHTGSQKGAGGGGGPTSGGGLHPFRRLSNGWASGNGRRQQQPQQQQQAPQQPALPFTVTTPGEHHHGNGAGGSAKGAAAAAGGKERAPRGGAAGLFQRLPGGKRMQRWWSHGHGDSWRQQQEQLQSDKLAMNQVPLQALARSSRGMSPAPSAPAALPGGLGNAHSLADSLNMPMTAMRGLVTRSHLPPPLAHSQSQRGAGSSAGGSRGATGGGGAASLHEATASPYNAAAGVAASVSASETAPASAVQQASGPTILGPGDCFAEVAYFTEVPKAEAVRSLTVCRVLVIPRSTYNAVAQDFPLSARQVLQNLKNRAAQLVAEFLPRDVATEILKEADLHDSAAAAAAKGQQAAAATAAAATATAAAAAADGAARPAATATGGAGGRLATAHHRLSPFSGADAQAETAVAAGTAAITGQQQQQPPGAAPTGTGLARVMSECHAPVAAVGTAAATAAAMRRLAAGAAAAGSSRGTSGGARARERPLLSTMSVQLSGRYSAGSAAAAGPLSRRGSLDAGSSSLYGRSPDAAAILSRSSAGAGAGGDLSPRREGTASPDGSGRFGQPHRRAGLGSTSVDLDSLDQERQARTLARFTAALSHSARRAASVGDSGGGAIAADGGVRAGEGLDVDRSPSQQQQQDGTAGSGPAASAGAAGPTTPAAATGAAAQHNPKQTQEQEQEQEQEEQQRLRQQQLAVAQLTGTGYEDASRLYSDEEVQAVAAAVSAALSPQQQRLLADLLRLRQLVNKAAAKFDQMRLTCFLHAAASGDVDVVQDMLRQGMSPNTADYDGRTALQLAAYRGHKDVVLALLFAGADTAPKDARGFDVMIEAARGGHASIIDVLKRSGARVGVSPLLQASLMCKATYEGKMDKLDFLLRAGCVPDAHDYDGQTALHVAAAEGNLPAARVLVAAGCDVLHKDRWGYSPLDVAHKVGAAPLVQFLAAQVPEEVAAAAAESWRRERTEVALAAARYGDAAALARLLERGCPVDAADYDGRSLLHVAVTNKQEAVVKQLLAAGANPNLRNSAGSTPLLEAAMNGSTAIQSELMSAGARLGLPVTEEAALLSSVLHTTRHDQLLALLTSGADPAAADYDSRTPLHIAASLGDVGALQLMADALADSSIERLTSVNWAALDRWGATPLQEAQRAGHTEAAEFLQQMVKQQQQQQQEERKGKGSVAK